MNKTMEKKRFLRNKQQRRNNNEMMILSIIRIQRKNFLPRLYSFDSRMSPSYLFSICGLGFNFNFRIKTSENCRTKHMVSGNTRELNTKQFFFRCRVLCIHKQLRTILNAYCLKHFLRVSTE